MNSKSVCTIFTDGSSKGNPGPGGWGAVLIFRENQNSKLQASPVVKNSDFYTTGDTRYKFQVRETGGREEHTTNNRMEIMAATQALLQMPDTRHQIQVFTDSSYLLNGITKWVYGWQKNGWKTATKQEVENQDLWQELVVVVKGKKIDWQLVKGHVGVAGNHRCDEIATAFADDEAPELFEGKLSDYKIKNILDISHNTTLKQKSAKSKVRSRAKAYSYLSMLNGKIEIHKTWAECERRVKGKSGARFKKSLDQTDEQAIIAEWSSN